MKASRRSHLCRRALVPADTCSSVYYDVETRTGQPVSDPCPEAAEASNIKQYLLNHCLRRTGNGIQEILPLQEDAYAR